MGRVSGELDHIVNSSSKSVLQASVGELRVSDGGMLKCSEDHSVSGEALRATVLLAALSGGVCRVHALPAKVYTESRTKIISIPHPSDSDVLRDTNSQIQGNLLLMTMVFLS